MLIQSKRVMNKVRDMTPCPTQPISIPDKNRIHPMDWKFYKLIKDKQKLFISSSK